MQVKASQGFVHQQPLNQKKNTVTGGCEAVCLKCEIKTAAGDKCGKDCPSRQKRNGAGDRCEVECPEGEIFDSAGDKGGEECPQGQKKNMAGESKL